MDMGSGVGTEGALIDVTPPLRNGMATYPGNPPFSIREVRSVAEGAHSTLSEVTMGTHSGLHVDAPAHFIAGAPGLEASGLASLVGPARVISIQAESAISVEELETHGIVEGERVLLKTRNSKLWQQQDFVADYVHLSTEAARYLAGLRPACLGVDYLSVGGHKSNGTEVHEALLGAGIVLIEGLDLSNAEPGLYDLVCLPLRLEQAEG
ncbi:MAG TPA: cyclase family protein, partial [Coriobacteriia bacterium]|nr:cyclase family protein [Coriobacteriia bacterium]